jgi:hypothetical protein
MLQASYGTLLFQIGLHFGIILHHPLQINLETSQIVMGFPIELVELNILLLQILSFPNLLCLIQLIGQVLVLF